MPNTDSITIIDNCHTNIPTSIFYKTLIYLAPNPPPINGDISVRFIVPRIKSEESVFDQAMKRAQNLYRDFNDPKIPISLDLINSHEVPLTDDLYSSPQYTEGVANVINFILPINTKVIMNLSLASNDQVRLTERDAPEYVLSHILYEKLRRERKPLWLYSERPYISEVPPPPTKQNWIKIYKQHYAREAPDIWGPGIARTAFYDYAIYGEIFNAIASGFTLTT